MRTIGDIEDFNPVFMGLNRNSAVFKDVQGVIENLHNDVTPGERIKYELIPKYYKTRHDIDNAFHVYLPRGMRLIYSITIFQGEKTAFLMELFVDHKSYERRFKF